MYQDLAAFYENPEVPNSFGGVEALHRSVKEKYSKKDVKHWLSQKDAYTLHKPVRHKFQRNQVFVSDIDRQFQADVVDMQTLAEFNKGYKYLLTCVCIDLFSKFAWAVPLKDKFGKSVKSGLEIIFKQRKPKVLQTDAPGNYENDLQGNQWFESRNRFQKDDRRFNDRGYQFRNGGQKDDFNRGDHINRGSSENFSRGDRRQRGRLNVLKVSDVQSDQTQSADEVPIIPSAICMSPVELPYVPILLNETFMKALLDTGAEKSFISEETYQKYFLYAFKEIAYSSDHGTGI
ncbi:uncharacterized transposon-derived protein F54H12.3 [Trichonephila clavipes]|nr:uncharacterized transposon-derived protein F54H12.3 [Trichonephila clavipes]